MGNGRATASPVGECDLIMKGGITSGVAYPEAVYALHERYRIRSIGGASAGAIAAAAAAAAEYGRDDLAEEDGFECLHALTGQLAAPGFLPGLFQPAPPARFVLRLLLALQNARGRSGTARRVVVQLLRELWLPTLAAVVVGLGLAAGLVAAFGGTLAEPSALGWLLVMLLLVAVAVVALAVASLVRVVHLIRRVLPDSFYGLCTGMDEDGTAQPALTPWLHESIQACAGKPPAKPLTFRDLDARGIRLEMMTTDLAYGRPARLPFDPGEEYLFSLEEFGRLFPAEIIDHLREITDVARRAGTGPDGGQQPELRPLPREDLPVLVATRMSLSFPILLSAVPLWTVKDRRPLRHWMSDGGIGSNFPIHFFDAWLPTRPTFGLNLMSTRASTVQAQPPGRAHPVPRSRTAIAGVVPFVQQILDTMQNWRDRMQAELPGFRERIQDITLEAGEGGMNLTMPPEIIVRIASKGRKSGERLRDGFDWDTHWFARYRGLMRLLDRHLNGAAEGPTNMADAYAAMQAELRKGMPTVTEDRGAFDAKWCRAAAESTRAFLETAGRWGDPGEADFRVGPPPVPQPVMRLTPRE